MSGTPQERLGKYLVLDEVGRGGFGIVYRAEDTALGQREVALKVLHPQLVVDPASVRLFTQEAGTAARLRHRHIVTIYEADTFEDRRYIAMEYLPGPSLAALLAREGPQLPERVAGWIEQVAAALDHAHHRGVVHRDLKPSNLLLDSEGGVVVTDFGLARATEASGGVSSSRDAGIMTGTARYMAPEQARRGQATAASDVYSLGVVAYELLTGHTPFEEGDAFALALQHISEPPPPLRQFRADLPEGVEQAVLKALAKDPAERYSAAGAFSAALGDAVHGPEEERDPGPRKARNDAEGGAAEEMARREREKAAAAQKAEEKARWAHVRRWILAGGVAALALVALAVALVWGVRRLGEWRDERATAAAGQTATARAGGTEAARLQPALTSPPALASDPATPEKVEVTVIVTQTVEKVVTSTPAQTSTWTPTETFSPTATSLSASARTHIIQKGETLYGIAKLYAVALQALRDANPGVDESELRPGQTLVIPEAATATVAPSASPKPKATAAVPEKRLDWGSCYSGCLASSSLVVTDLATGQQSQIWNSTDVLYFAAWSADGSRVLCSPWARSYGSHCYQGLRVMDANGANPNDIWATICDSGEEAGAARALWRADGRELAVRWAQLADYGVFTVGPNGSGPHRVVASAIDDYPVAWSVDGKWIAVQAASDGKYYGLEVNGNRRVPLADLGPLKFYDQRYWPWLVTDQVQCINNLNPNCK